MPRGLSRVLLAVAVLLSGALLYPLLNESAQSSCSAFERLAVRESIRREVQSGRLSDRDAPLVSLFGRSLQDASRGSFTAALVKDKHPNLPPFVGCTVEYYNLLFNPSKSEQDMD